MEGEIDSTFITSQRDLFSSGIVAEIGVNAFAVWTAIKFHANHATGKAFPGMREIAKLIGTSKSTVDRAVDVLEQAHLLRVVADAKFKRKGQTYIARERLAVRLGNRVICFVVIDYVPENLRGQINRISQSLRTGEHNPEAWAEVEIIPGPDFLWDEKSQTLKALIHTSEAPFRPTNNCDYAQKLGAEILAKVAPNLHKALPINSPCMSHP